MPPTENQRLAFREQFRSLHAEAFQAWFERLARTLHPVGDFQAIRRTSGDGGLDGLAINSQTVYQVYAPARMSELRDSETAAKIRADFDLAYATLGQRLRAWTFVHNHPEAKLGKLSLAAVASLKARHSSVDFSVLDVESLWERLKFLPDHALSTLFGQPLRDDSLDLIGRLIRTETGRLEEKFDDLVTRISSTKGVPVETLRAILNAFSEHSVPDSEIEQRLYAKAAEYQSLKETLARRSNEDPVVQHLRLDATRAIDSGNLPAADELLMEAESRDTTVAAELLESAHSRLESAAESRAERGRLAMLQVNYEVAAAHFAEAQKFVSHSPERAIGYGYFQAKSLYRLGEEFGRVDALSRSVEVYRALPLRRLPNDNPLGWAAVQSEIGDVLSLMGEYSGDVNHLHEAVAAYENALLEFNAANAPLAFATTRSNLGVTLKIIGERERDLESLRRSISAFREALTIRTRSRFPGLWAQTQMNLASALMRLGQFEQNTQVLRQALATYRRALRGCRARDRMHVKINIGTALHELGQIEGTCSKVRSATKVYREVLDGLPAGREPLVKALAHVNLGNAMCSLGASEGDISRFYEALHSYDEALSQVDPGRARTRWCEAMYGRGRALLEIGQREPKIEALRDSVSAFREAADVIGRDFDPRQWARFEEGASASLLALGLQSRERNHLEAAAMALQACINALEGCRAAFELARVKGNLKVVEDLIRQTTC